MAEFGWYSEKVLEHYQNPRNVGKIEDADGVGVVGNPVCGDMMMITIKVRDDRIEDIKFKTFGCGAAIATTSMVTEMVKGRTIEEALQITNQEVAEALDGLPPIKMHCSLLAEEAIKAAIEDYQDKSQSPKPKAQDA
nr:Fe-S cluster assembly scaffold protein NifU [Anaerolineae bacterium]